MIKLLINYSEEMFEMIKSNHDSLQKNNEALLKELENTNKRYEEQQFTWETEINDLTQTLDLLKEQLRKE